MTILVLYNVGNRDVERAGQPIKPARSQGKAFLEEVREAKDALIKAEGRPSQEEIEHYRSLWDSISLPIITPMLGYVLAREARISRLVLYTSDQPMDPQKPHFHDSDTIHTGQIVAEKLRRTRTPPYQNKIDDIEVVPVSGIKPNLYDEAFARFRKLVLAEADGVARCYALVTAGTPQFNMALASHAVMIFGDRCSTVYLPEGSDQAFALNIGAQLRQATEQQMLATHLERRDFAAAAVLMDGPYHAALRHLVHYGKHRFHFDFKRAREHLDAAWQEAADRPELREEIQPLGTGLNDLIQQSLEALINELYWNARLCYLNGRYVDFLGRLFRLREAIGRHVVELVYQLPTDNAVEKNMRDLAGYVGKNAALEAYLADYRWGKDDKKKGIWAEKGFSAPLVVAMVGYLAEPSAVTDGLCSVDQSAVFARLHALLHKMDSLSELRNDSIIAHGWRGVSRDILLREYGAKATPDPAHDPPLEDLAAVMALLTLAADDPYEAVADLVRADILRVG
jgi:hypothetical protein